MTSPGSSFQKVRRRTVEILLWCGAGLGTLSILAALAAASFGIVPLVFTSGSMSPEIEAGSLGLARTVPAGELRRGDVVSVTGVNGIRVTHRIVAIEQQTDVVVLTLKGDTNPSPDRESHPVEEADRVFFTAPHLGRVIMFLSSPWGMFLGGLSAAALLFWAFRRRPPSDTDTDTDPGTGTGGDGQRSPVDPRERSSGHRADHAKARSSVTLLAAGLPALLLVTANSGTAASFNDTGTVTTTGFSTHRVLQPNPVDCKANSKSITLGTPSLPDQRYTYWARAYTPGGVAVSAYKKMTGSPAKATFTTAEFSPPLASATTYTFRIHSRIGAPGATGATGWESEVFQRALFSQTGTTLACRAAIVPPNIAFTQPVDGFNGTRAELLSLVNADCGAHGTQDPAICGTAIDPDGSIASVQYILQRSSFFGTYCWTGSGYPAFGSCAYRSATRNVGENRWSIPGDVYQGLIAWNYKLTIKATDNLGAIAEKSINFRVSPS